MCITNCLAAAFPEALCSELQQEKQRLESHVGELKDSVNQLRGEVQELAQRERLLVAFPELNPLPQGSPQSMFISLNNPMCSVLTHHVDFVDFCIVCQCGFTYIWF